MPSPAPYLNSPRPPPPPRRSLRLAWIYFARALHLRCPECGVSPVFPPVRAIRSPAQIFDTLDGCPRCGYPYEREPGYFLMATWAVSYSVGAFPALALYLYLEYVRNASLTTILWTCIPLSLLLTLLTIRHARAVWLAIDHFFDPHVKGEKPRSGARSVEDN